MMMFTRHLSCSHLHTPCLSLCQPGTDHILSSLTQTTIIISALLVLSIVPTPNSTQQGSIPLSLFLDGVARSQLGGNGVLIDDSTCAMGRTASKVAPVAAIVLAQQQDESSFASRPGSPSSSSMSPRGTMGMGSGGRSNPFNATLRAQSPSSSASRSGSGSGSLVSATISPEVAALLQPPNHHPLVHEFLNRVQASIAGLIASEGRMPADVFNNGHLKRRTRPQFVEYMLR